jgi:hypothetical protein
MPPHRQVSCIQSGYQYRFEGKRRWRASSSELWETVMSKAVCGRVVGRRNIDGSQVVVVKAGGKYYAALPHAVKAR